MTRGKSHSNWISRAQIMRTYAKSTAMSTAKRGWRAKTYERCTYDGRDDDDGEGGG
jgi:hypothetical protein